MEWSAYRGKYHFAYADGTPCYPYEGTPMDSSVLNMSNFNEYNGCPEGNLWDFTRFKPEYFRSIEDAYSDCVNCTSKRILSCSTPMTAGDFPC